MNHRKLIFALAGLAIMVASSVTAFAQPESTTRVMVEPSYDVELQLLIGSNDGAKSDLPANLSTVARQLKGAMPFANYRVASTFLGRLSNGGNFEYKSLSNIFGQENEVRSQTFLDWSLVRLKNLPTVKGGQGYQAEAFRFGARVPVVTGASVKDENGKQINVVNYESIGLNLGRVGIADSTPTLIGTLNLPGSSGTIFLVMTVKPVDM